MPFWKRKYRHPSHDRSKTLYLHRANHEVLSLCRCKSSREALVSAPRIGESWNLADTLGWCWTCQICGMAFTFAVAKAYRTTLEEIASKELPRIVRVVEGPDWEISEEVLLKDYNDWSNAMSGVLQNIQRKQIYVYLDGFAVEAKPGCIRLDGRRRKHEFPILPHLAAQVDPTILDVTLHDPDYWDGEPMSGDAIQRLHELAARF